MSKKGKCDYEDWRALKAKEQQRRLADWAEAAQSPEARAAVQARNSLIELMPGASIPIVDIDWE
jgi:hypothetical protein